MLRFFPLIPSNQWKRDFSRHTIFSDGTVKASDYDNLVDFGVYFKGLYMLFLLLPRKIKYTEIDMGQIGDGPVKKPFYKFVKGLDLLGRFFDQTQLAWRRCHICGRELNIAHPGIQLYTQGAVLENRPMAILGFTDQI